MSTRFPLRRPAIAVPLQADLRLHGPVEEDDDKDGLAWVRWLFQSVRAQRTALVFQSDAVDRGEALSAWQKFAAEQFLPALAPALLRSWTAARSGDDGVLAAGDTALQSALPAVMAERSAAAGAILLEQTRGAKYQAALGRFRVRVDQGECPGHLATAWSAVAALFQIPPLDLLSEYLRQEWAVATQHCPHHEPPQGPLGFSGLAHRALHEAGLMGISEPQGPVADGNP